LDEAQDAAPLVVLDLRELRFIDSAGVHAILDAARDIRRPGSELVIVRGPARVDRVLTLTKVDKQVAILDSFPPRSDSSLQAEGVGS
jgi:anti-anti-sigma factor